MEDFPPNNSEKINKDISKFEKEFSKNIVTAKDAEKVWDRMKNDLPLEKKEKLKKLLEELNEGIEDIDDSKDVLEELRKIIPPIISVPLEFCKQITEQGFIKKLPDYTDHLILAGTIGRKPHIRDSEEKRVLFKIINNQIHLEPRFTLPNPNSNKKHDLFCGVFVALGPGSDNLKIGNDVEMMAINE